MKPIIVPLTLMGLRSSTLLVKLLISLFVAKYLGLVELSVYGLVSAASIAAPAMLGLGLSQTISRRAVTLPREEMVKPVLFYTMVVTTIIVVLTLIAAAITKDRYNSGEIALVGAIVLFEHINNDAYQFQVNLSRNLTANALHFVRGALWCIVYMATAFYNPEFRTIDALLVAWLLGSMAALAAFVVMIRGWPWGQAIRQISGLPRWLVEEVPQAFHLYVSGFATAVSWQADKFFVSFFMGLELAGVYIFFMQIYSAINNLIFVSIIQPARPRLVRKVKECMNEFAAELRKTARNAAGIALLLAIIGGLGVSLILPSLGQDLLIEWHVLLGVILIACAIQSGSEAFRLGFYAQHADKAERNNTLQGVLLMIVLYTFGPWLFGLWGAAVALLGVTSGRLTLQARKLWPILKMPAEAPAEPQ